MRALTQAERNRRRTADAGHHDELVYFTDCGGTYHVDVLPDILHGCSLGHNIFKP